jgi:23S rRNA pseudouridine2605 synthase
MMMLHSGERIQKVLANIGLASRRQIDSWIVSGRFTVDGSLAKPGQLVHHPQKIFFDNKEVIYSEPDDKPRIIMYHKPCGEICTRSDPQKRMDVFRNLPKIDNGRWILIGRLDINSSGLLLFTNVGAIAHTIMHPSFQHERCYRIRAYGSFRPEKLQRLRQGIFLEEGLCKLVETKYLPYNGQGMNHWIEVKVVQGYNRMLRRMFKTQGLIVNKLIRMKMSDFHLPDKLKPGQYQEIGLEQVKLFLGKLSDVKKIKEIEDV